MGIFSLLFKKNNSLLHDENIEIETVNTLPNKIEIVYQSGMLYKSIDSYIPNIDIMEIAVPIAMEIFDGNYTVYSTEKLLSNTFFNLELNLSLRKEIFLLNNKNYPTLEDFKSIVSIEVCILDNSFISKINNNEISLDTYKKLRQIFTSTLKKAGETDPYFNTMNTIFSSYFDLHNIDYSLECLGTESISMDSTYKSNLMFVNSPHVSIPTHDIMCIVEKHLNNTLSSKSDLDTNSNILSKVLYSLHTNIQNRLNEYEDNITYIEYLHEIEKSLDDMDFELINLVKNNNIDETTYLIFQDILMDAFMDAKTFDLYIEAISIKLNIHIEKNNYFKEYICTRIHDIFQVP
ncbi:MAG: hypothetical protein RR645_05010, partial [Clostridium sp.]